MERDTHTRTHSLTHIRSRILTAPIKNSSTAVCDPYSTAFNLNNSSTYNMWFILNHSRIDPVLISIFSTDFNLNTT